MTPISSAFCCPVLASAAGVPVLRSVSACPSGARPAAVPPAAASRRPAGLPVSARSQSSTASAGSAASRSAIGQTRSIRAGGKPLTAPACVVQPLDQDHPGGRGGDGVAGHGILEAGQPGGVRPPLGQQPVALRHGGVVRRDLAGMAGFQRPDQAVEEAAAAGRALLEQPVHLRGQPDRGDAAADLRLAARRGAVERGTRAGRSARRAAVPVPISVSPSSVREPSGDGPAVLAAVARQVGDRARRAGRGREPAGKRPPAGWSCRCRWRRTAR